MRYHKKPLEVDHLNYYFAPIAEGLGDLLITLPAIHCLIKTGTPTYLILRSPKQVGVAELIPGLAGWLSEPDFLSKILHADDRLINLRDHYLQTENVFGSDSFFAKFGRITIVDVFERICKDVIKPVLDTDVNFRNYERFAFNRQPKFEKTILLVPGSAGSFKCWTATKWIDLHHALSNLGIESVMLGQPEKSAEVEELLKTGLPWLPTPTFASAIDVVSSAAAMVSVDTGLLHLSVQQGKPSVGLYLERSIFVRPESNCFPIYAPDCQKECLGWTLLPPNDAVTFPKFEEVTFTDCSAAAGKRCMEQITVEAVLKGLKTQVPELNFPK